MEHPFFVYDRGWCSFSPARTSQRYDLPCEQLNIGDRCVSLKQKVIERRLSETPSLFVATFTSSTSANSNSQIISQNGRPVGRLRMASDSVFQFHGK